MSSSCEFDRRTAAVASGSSGISSSSSGASKSSARGPRLGARPGPACCCAAGAARRARPSCASLRRCSSAHTAERAAPTRWRRAPGCRGWLTLVSSAPLLRQALLMSGQTVLRAPFRWFLRRRWRMAVKRERRQRPVVSRRLRCCRGRGSKIRLSAFFLIGDQVS